MTEYLRPWKLVSLAVGLALLIAGSFYYRAPDWDVPISFIMAGLTYLFAPWTLRVILENRGEQVIPAAVATWFTVDGSYAMYWSIVNPVALEMMRGANVLASLTLYFTCGLIWLYNGSLRDLIPRECPTFERRSS